MAETSEMESPSARQDCFVEAQEDSTSVVEAGGAPSPGGTITTITATIADAGDDDGDYAARPSVVRDSREDLVMVCERLDERPGEDEGAETRQSSDKPEEAQGDEEEEEKEANMGLAIEKKADEDARDEKGETDAKSTEDNLRELEESKPRTSEAQDRGVGECSTVWENGLENPASPDVSRKRPAASDFLPIGAEIKRIGIEISEEQATQLKNDVRRLSPVLVSLRERTLGEVSLTSESCLFGDELDGRTPRCNDVPAGSFVADDSETQSVDQNREKQDVSEEEEKVVTGRINAAPSECTSSVPDNAEDTLNCASRKMDYDSEGEITPLGATSTFSKSDSLDGTTE